MENSVIIATNAAAIPTTFNFKNSHLNKFAEQIAQIAIDSVERNVQLAKIFGKIMSTKCYEKDGFSSVADFASKTFGVDKAQAYALARVGNRFYNSDSETAQKVVNLMAGKASNLAELVNLSDDQLEAAMASDDLKADTTQKQLRELVKASKTVKPKVVKLYNLNIITATMVNDAKAVPDFKEMIDESNILSAAGFDPDKDKLVKLADLTEEKYGKPGTEVKQVKCGVLYVAIDHQGRKTATIAAKEVKPVSKVKPVPKSKDELLNDPDYQEFLKFKAAKAAKAAESNA